MSVTSIRLKPEVEEALRKKAEQLQGSRNWLINQAIREYLEKENQEEIRWKDTFQALDSLDAGKVIDGDAVHSWLGSWGSGGEINKPEK